MQTTTVDSYSGIFQLEVVELQIKPDKLIGLRSLGRPPILQSISS